MRLAEALRGCVPRARTSRGRGEEENRNACAAQGGDVGTKNNDRFRRSIARRWQMMVYGTSDQCTDSEIGSPVGQLAGQQSVGFHILHKHLKACNAA